jgi:para-nitrobenzyl esterase
MKIVKNTVPHIAVAVVLAILGGQHLAAALNQPVHTESGLVTGAPAADKSIAVFKGIPFAAPPVGDGRWRAPQPPVKWQGIRAADRFGANCMQTIVEEKKPWTHEFMAHGDVSEDCLFLNIWTAGSPNERRPVLVFLHGGANTEGSGSIDGYNGQGLARKGVVMITINYRLGVFGFFTHPELSGESANHVSGNYALLDQIAALNWVKKNIAAFGGDPERVTVAGQSAGASDIALLIVSPLAKGLFQRAIMESGGAPGTGGGRPLSVAEADGVKFAEAKGAHSLAELRALPAKDIFSPVAGLRFGPVTDGYVVPAAPSEIFAAGKQNDVPTLTGSNADENGASPKPGTTAAQFESQARQRHGDLAAEFLKIYPVQSDREAPARSNEAARDRQRVLYDEWAVSRSKTAKTPVYVYFYNHVLPGPDSGQYGAFHTSEVPYVLNSLAESGRPFTAEDRKVAETLSSYWANFAAGGDPNGKGLPHWPSTTEQPRMVMELGDVSKAIPAAGTDAKYEFLRKLTSMPTAPAARTGSR